MPSIFDRRSVCVALAILSPLLAAAVEHVLWPLIRPFAWLLFYPAVFFSAWAGGVWGGIAATGISTLLVWWSFVPPEHTLVKEDPRYLIPMAGFWLMGVLVSFFQARLTEATKRAAHALAESQSSADGLRQAHDLNARLIEQASDGILIADLSGRILEVNSAGCLMLGFSRGEMLHLSIADLVSPSETERLHQARERLLAGGSHIQEWELRHKDRNYRTFEVSAKILPDLRWQIFLRDIGERKTAEKRLQQVSRANRALSKCNQALIRAVDEQNLLQQVCDVVVSEAGYPLCWAGQIQQDEAKSVKVIAQSGQGSDYVSALNLTWEDSERGRGPTGMCIRTGKAITCSDIAGDQEMAPWRTEALRHGYASSVAIPLLVEGEAFGAFCIYATEPGAFHSEEVELLYELANDLSFGISAMRIRSDRIKVTDELRVLNAELEERVLERTRELQRSREREFEIGSRIQETLLVDHPPSHLAGIEICALSLPTQRIDGDFVAFMEPREQSFDVIVGDVMGKGIPAALLGAATKAHFLKAFGHLSALSKQGKLPEPSEIVAQAHLGIVRQLIALESFVTLCYARIDLRSAVLKVVDCGHTGIVQLHRSDGQTDLLQGNNLPLGVRENESYEQCSFPIEAGDTLLFFSDGITEARNSSGEVFGQRRLRDCIESCDYAEPSRLVQTIHSDVTAFCGTDKLADDVTIVAVRMEEVGPPLAKAEMNISSDLCELQRARDFVRSFCGSTPAALFNETTVDALELAIDEAASNIMRHAYLGRTDRRIHLEAAAFPDHVQIRLHHQGRSFHPEPLSEPPLDRVGESGFGLYILSRCVDNVRYCEKKSGGNCIVLTKFLHKHVMQESELPCKFPSKMNTA